MRSLALVVVDRTISKLAVRIRVIDGFGGISCTTHRREVTQIVLSEATITNSSDITNDLDGGVRVVEAVVGFEDNPANGVEPYVIHDISIPIGVKSSSGTILRTSNPITS